MKQRAIFTALAVLALSAPAAAEPLRLAQAMEPGVVPPYEVLTIVRSAGFDPLGQPFRRGPNYVLRAIGGDDQEVRVVVNARHGEIVRVVPIATASRMPPPRGGVTMGPYERMPPGYVPSGPPGAYRGGPSVADEDDEPVMQNDPRAPRPPDAVPGAPPRYGNAAPPPVIGATRPYDDADGPPLSEPHVITSTEPDPNGLLPPPPERFPQRAATPAVKPKPPVKRDVASIPKQAQPKPAPLPKPRPAARDTAASAAPPAQSAAPAAVAPQPKSTTETTSPPLPVAPAPGAKPDVSKSVPN